MIDRRYRRGGGRWSTGARQPASRQGGGRVGRRSRLTAALFALLSAGLASRAGAQISPGPLARAHRSLEGALNCTNCHSPRREPMSTMCLACHKEIAQLVSAKRGYHARVAGTEQQACEKCHPDHAGVDFRLISWPGGSADRFDHALAGWPLEGTHATTKCADCHTTRFRTAPEAALAPAPSTAGWVGLQTGCAGCHRNDDQHRGALGTSCDRCHDSGDWRRAPGFDHAKTRYPLRGQHAVVACAKCHLSPRLPLGREASGAPVPAYRPVPHASCGDCHEDPHRGRLSKRCNECHSTDGFATVNRRGFNHALTRYPLRGRHATVVCAGCHGADMTRKDPPFATCTGCHADPHRGQATRSGQPVDCASCHRVEGFAPSTYTPADHRSAPFMLEGRHAQVACTACHTPDAVVAGGTRVARLRMSHRHCADCHADAHGGQLTSRPDRGACESCHVVAGWAPSTFGAAAHAGTGFPIDGRHAAVPCASCHAANATGIPSFPVASTGTAGVKLALGRVTCATCHVDAHAGRYAVGGALFIDGGCAACHGTSAFRPSSVNVAMHARFRFRLEGAHRAVPCAGCHQELKAPPATATLAKSARSVVRFPDPASLTRTTTCASCHASPHGMQFDGRPDRGACEACHGVDAFAPAGRFDHEKDAAFPLTGAHAAVACDKCHHSEPAADGVRRVIYRPLSSTCEGCHKGAPRGVEAR